MSMFRRMFAKPKQETKSNALIALDKLNETLEILEKKEKVLRKKATVEFRKAVEFMRVEKERAVIRCLKRRRLYEQQIEQLGNLDALRTGAATMKAMLQKAPAAPVKVPAPVPAKPTSEEDDRIACLAG